MICLYPALVQFCPITYHSILLPPIICLKNNSIQFILSPRCNFPTASAARLKRLKRSTFLFWSTSAVDVFFRSTRCQNFDPPTCGASSHSLANGSAQTLPWKRGSVCGTVGRVVAYDITDLRFQSNHRKNPCLSYRYRIENIQ